MRGSTTEEQPPPSGDSTGRGGSGHGLDVFAPLLWNPLVCGKRWDDELERQQACICGPFSKSNRRAAYVVAVGALAHSEWREEPT
jgi:hypothetical protein